MKPIGILICGPSGVGKSSKTNKMLENAGANVSDFLIIDPDKLDLPTHEEQSVQALKNLFLAIKDSKNVVYIATCGGTGRVKKILSVMKQNKYRTIVSIPYTSLPTALARINERTQAPVHEAVIRELHAYFKTKAERFMNLDNLDEVYLYNNETDFNLVLEKKKKKIQCFTPDIEFYFDISKYC